MKIGTIEAEGTGLTNGHPAVIVSGKMKQGTVCKANGLLSLDAAAGEFEAYAFGANSGAAYVALEPVAAVVKAGGAALTAAELAAVQKSSNIYFV
jgi:hypothetical protein